VHVLVTLIAGCDKVSLAALHAFDDAIVRFHRANLLALLLVPNLDHAEAAGVYLVIDSLKSIDRMAVRIINHLDLFEATFVIVHVVVFLKFSLAAQLAIVPQRLRTTLAAGGVVAF
jgi:hypothetical protein